MIMNMKKFLILISLIIVAVFASSSFAWNVGSGTETDPYVIASASDFSYFRYRVNSGLDAEGSYYRLSNDIQITQQIRTAPVGMSDTPFTGHFDGQGHTIYIKIMPLNEDDEALLSYDRAPFGIISTTGDYAVKNLHVGGYAGGYLAAGIVSNLVSGTIQNCTFSGDIEAEPVLDDEESELHKIHAGGIAANIRGGKIMSCDFSGNVTTNGNGFFSYFSYSGGIAGAMSGGTITGCTVKHYSVITANGNSDSGRSKSAGGIVGYLEVDDLSTNNDDATVSDCTFEGGEVNSEYTAGGITGTAYGGILKNNTVSENTKINGNTFAGGVAGLLSAGGLVKSNNILGGLVSSDARAAGGVVGLLELGYVEDNDSRASVSGSASYQGGVIGEIHNHEGSSANIKNNTYSGAAYGIGIDENLLRNQDTGCKNTSTENPISLSILTTSIPSAVVNTQYEYALQYQVASGYSVSWSKLSGDLPGNFAISENGVISGITDTSGVFPFVVGLSAAGITVSKDFTLTVLTHSDTQSSVKITSTITPDGKIGESYTTVLTSSPSGAYWSLSGGLLPPGLTLSSDGVLSGVPTVVGVFSFYVTASMASYSSSTQEFEITISAYGSSGSTVQSSGGGGGGCNSLAVSWLALFAIILRKKVS